MQKRGVAKGRRKGFLSQGNVNKGSKENGRVMAKQQPGGVGHHWQQKD